MMLEFKYPVQPGTVVFPKREKFWFAIIGSGYVNPSLNTKATKLKMKRAERMIELANIANRNPFCFDII
jgi:hypothetical protein